MHAMAQAAETKPTATPDVKGVRDRSPSFPFIPLKTAIERLIAFETYFKRHPGPLDKAGLAWDMKPKSSQSFSTLAALKSFGLVGYQGAGTGRVAVIAEDGRTYLRAQQESIKQEVLKRCALRPKNIAKYWSKWGADRPPNPVCLDELIIDGAFSDSGAEAFLNVYDATIAYAGLTESDNAGTTDEHSDENGEEDRLSRPEVNVGDLVQREAHGVLTFPKALRVRKIIEDQGQKWFFVDGTESGFLVSEAIVEAKGTAATVGALTPPVDPLPADWREERLLDEKGDEIFVRYKGEPSKERYEFIRDYLDFKLKRMKSAATTEDATRQPAQPAGRRMI